MAVVLLGFIPSFSSSSHAHLVDNPILWLLSSGAVSTRRFFFYRLPLFPSHPRNLLLYSSPPCKCRTCAFYAPHKYTTTTIVVGLLREVSRLSFKKTNGRTKGAENGLLWRRKSLPGTPNPSVNLRQPANAPIRPGAAFACMGATQLSPGYCCSSYHESPANRTCALATNTAFLRARRLSTSASSASPLIEVSHSSMSA